MVRDDFGLPMLEKKSGVNIASKVFDKNLQSPVEGLCSKASISDEPKCNPDPFKDKLKEKIDDASLSNQNHLPSKLPISGDSSDVLNKQAPIPTVHPLVCEGNPSSAETNGDSDWQQVKRKAPLPPNQSNPVAKSSDTCPPHEINATSASSMPIYAALTRTMSKSQLKKARRSGGKTPPFKH
ncbi:hypothetical protein ACET3Z_013172 [Daucus carota]